VQGVPEARHPQPITLDWHPARLVPPDMVSEPDGQHTAPSEKSEGQQSAAVAHESPTAAPLQQVEAETSQ
jgi:hypothetical protein